MQLENTHIIEESLEKYGIFASRTRGTSMWPVFRTHRDTVYIVKPEGTLRPRDIALYTASDGRYIMHRVYRVKENEYIIRGDNTYVTEHVPHDAVIGVLMEFDRKGKHHTVKDKDFRLYSAVWTFFYPIRFVLYHIARFFWHLIKPLVKRNKQKKPENEK